MENEDKVGLKWGLFGGKVGILIIALFGLVIADNILLGTADNRFWLAPLLLIASLALLAWNHKRGHTKGDELERRVELYCLAIGGIGVMMAVLFDYVLGYLDGSALISDYAFTPMKLPFLLAFAIMFAEQGWKVKLATPQSGLLKL